MARLFQLIRCRCTKGLDIGTAKIEPEKRTVVHYLLDVVMPE